MVVAVLLLNQVTDLIGTLERRFYDFGSTSTARVPSDRIAIIAIDDQSIANIGRWPWSRDIHARLIDQLSAAKAKTIVETVFFIEPQVDRELSFIRQMKSLLPAGADASNTPLARVIAEAELALDTDAVLAASMRNAGNVLVPSVFALGEPQGNPDKPLPEFMRKSAIPAQPGFAIPAISGQVPIEQIGAAAAGVAHLNQIQDVDGSVRMEPLLVDYYGSAVPSMALLAAAINKRQIFLAWAILFFVLAAAGVYDFYLWEYDYGHNLSPNAPIKIPGASFQPPLFGTKVILNFVAKSFPHTGGYLTGLGTLMAMAAWWLKSKLDKNEKLTSVGGNADAARERLRANA